MLRIPYTNSLNTKISKKADSVLSLMTLKEKIGQMNQYTGFWEVTGPAPKAGEQAKRYEQLKSGLIGSMLNVTGIEEVRKVQRIAVEESRLGIPLIIGYYMNANQWQPFVQGGMYYGILTSSSTNSEVTETYGNQTIIYDNNISSSNIYNKNHFGLLAGAGVRYAAGKTMIGTLFFAA